MSNSTIDVTPKILEIDPWLEKHKLDLQFRIENYFAIKNKLLQGHPDLKSFANGHLYFGFHLDSEGWYYREWAPNADSLHLIGDFNDWNSESHPLKKIENGCWEIFIPGREALHHQSRVKVRVSANGMTRDRIPLYIQRTVQDPSTHDFSGQIWMESKPFEWSDSQFSVDSEESLFIYEAHVGMAQDKEGIGTYKEFTEKVLPHVKASGYNAVQLMAIMQHPYYASFGYHVSNFFAVSSWFGTPEDLKELIDTAHSMGIAVLMDIVHSHAVKNIAEGINEFDGTVYQFFHEGPKGDHKAWDSKLFNYGKEEVLHFLLSNIKYWMDTYHFDGFRFDGVTSMIYHDRGLGTHFDNYDKYFSMNTDTEAITYLQLANDLIKEIRPDAISIAEDMSGMPGMCLPIQDGGIGFDYRLSMGVPDFWIKLMKQKDEEWSMRNIWHELTSHRPFEKRIGYAESHDQALVGDKTLMFQLADQEMYWHMSKFQNSLIIDRAIALHKLIRMLTQVLSCEGYLNFMGNEFGHPEWIDFPREGNNWSFKYSRRQWRLIEDQDLRYVDLYRFDNALLDFTKKHNLMGSEEPNSLWIDESNKMMAFKKQGLIFLFNLNSESSFEEFQLPTYEAGQYKVIFDSDAEHFGGQSRIAHDVVYSTQPLAERHNDTGIIVYSPSRTVMVLRKI